MRVVLDTNVLASGIFFGGVPEKILDAWLHDKFVVYATPSILDEYLRVLIKMNTEAENEIVFQWLASFSELCHLVSDVEPQKLISRDPTPMINSFVALPASKLIIS